MDGPVSAGKFTRAPGAVNLARALWSRAYRTSSTGRYHGRTGRGPCRPDRQRGAIHIETRVPGGSMRLCRLIAVPATAFAITTVESACGDGAVEPSERLSGRYALVTANDGPLPSIFERSPDGRYREIVSGELDFHSRARVASTRLFRSVDPRPNPPRSESQLEEGLLTYVISGDRVMLTFPALLGRPAYDDTASLGSDRTHVLVRSRLPGPDGGYIVLNLRYARTP